MPFVKFIINKGDIKKLLTTSIRMQKGAVKGTKKGMKMLRSEARKFDGVNVPKIRTGNLRDSIDYEVKVSGNEIIGFLGSDALYAKIQEFGGTITARRAKYLVFKTNNGWRRVESVTIPPRPFLSTAIESNKDEFKEILNKEIISAWKGKFLGIF